MISGKAMHAAFDCWRDFERVSLRPERSDAQMVEALSRRRKAVGLSDGAVCAFEERIVECLPPPPTTAEQFVGDLTLAARIGAIVALEAKQLADHEKASTPAEERPA